MISMTTVIPVPLMRAPRLLLSAYVWQYLVHRRPCVRLRPAQGWHCRLERLLYSQHLQSGPTRHYPTADQPGFVCTAQNGRHPSVLPHTSVPANARNHKIPEELKDPSSFRNGIGCSWLSDALPFVHRATSVRQKEITGPSGVPHCM